MFIIFFMVASTSDGYGLISLENAVVTVPSLPIVSKKALPSSNVFCPPKTPFLNSLYFCLYSGDNEA